MNDLQIFNNKQFGEIRMVDIDNKVYFVAKDVATALGYRDTINAIKQHCRGVAKHHIPHPQSKNKTLEVNIIPEGDIYRLVAHSELPSAEKFESWVFDEVLPSINKHGAYMTPQKIEEVLLNPDTIIKLATSLKAERELRVQAEKQIADDKPRVEFAKAVAETSGCLSIANMAKLIKQNGYDTGQNRLFSWMRENGYLVQRKGASYNSPTQAAVNSGWLKSKVSVIKFNDGTSKEEITPMVTGKGQIYFINLFKKKGVM